MSIRASSQHIIARKGVNVIGSFIGNNVLQAVANGLNSGMLDFEYMITHKLSFDQFDEDWKRCETERRWKSYCIHRGLPGES